MPPPKAPEIDPPKAELKEVNKADAATIVEPKPEAPKPKTRPVEETAKVSQEPKVVNEHAGRSIMGQSILFLALVSLLSLTTGALLCLMLVPTTKIYGGYIIHDRTFDSMQPDDWSTETKRRVAEHDRSIRELQEGRKP